VAVAEEAEAVAEVEEQAEMRLFFGFVFLAIVSESKKD
jgi:hypothetical protein